MAVIVLLVVMLALCVALGVVVYQRDTARHALTMELWQRYLRERSELQPRLQVPEEGASWWDNAAATLPPAVVAALTAPPGTPDVPAEGVRVEVRNEDTLESLTARHGLHVAELAWNAFRRGGSSTMIIYPGE